jgi:hypothetical protein
MTRLGRMLAGSVAAVMLALAAPAGAGETMRHSGSIVSIAADGRTFVLAEIGRWRPGDGITVVTHLTITIVSTTTFAIVARADAPAPDGLPGEFVEMPLTAEGLYVNDYVTVDCLHEATRLVALKVTVTEVLPTIDTDVAFIPRSSP